MTKPSNFNLNSDYLSLAQVSNNEFTAFFLQELFPEGQAVDRYQDFTIQATQGAIDSVMISLNNADYKLGSYLRISSVPALSISVYRTSPNTLRVRLHEFNNQTGGYSMPLQTVKIKVSSFKPPNVF